jgi:hypothetical protein
MESLKFHPGPSCRTLLRPASGPPPKRPYSRFRGSPPAWWAACSSPQPIWTSHPVRLRRLYPVFLSLNDSHECSMPRSQFILRQNICIISCTLMVSSLILWTLNCLLIAIHLASPWSWNSLKGREATERTAAESECILNCYFSWFDYVSKWRPFGAKWWRTAYGMGYPRG